MGKLVRVKILLITLLIFVRLGATPTVVVSYSPDQGGEVVDIIDACFILRNISADKPRMILNKQKEDLLREKMQTDAVVQNLYKAIRLNANSIMQEPLLERDQIGMRLLHVSREMLYRVNMLGLVYRLEKDALVLSRLNEELIAVCSFTDWNPTHFLDVAEMSLAVALALDWTAGDLPESTINLAQESLIVMGLEPSWDLPDDRFPFYFSNNWNQVCNGGMIAAAIAVAEREPVLAAKTISRALEGLPYAMTEYGPDGVYPEGSSYWEYATAYSVLTISMLRSAFGHDFGTSDFPGFLESAHFRTLCNAPSGWYYNFADCNDRRNPNGDLVLAWFASESGNAGFYEESRFMRSPEDMGKLTRWAGAALVWVAEYEEGSEQLLPTAWKGEGANPIFIFRDAAGSDNGQYYFGGKGGRGQVANHGNMDAGSFVFELDGVRWSVDPGRQHYHDLERIGFDLWNMCQDCERWTLLAQNSFGHSTITVNGELHKAKGYSPLLGFDDGPNPSALVDLTPALGPLVAHAERRFTRDSSRSLLVEDLIDFSDETEFITWQMLTTADVSIQGNSARLQQDGAEIEVQILSHPSLTFSLVALDPPPLAIDKKVEGLKRIEIIIPSWIVEDDRLNLRVRLVGEDAPNPFSGR